MSGYDKLFIVDQYEESYDNRVAVRRACYVMSEYLAGLKRPLPGVVAQAIKVAREYYAGVVAIGRLRVVNQQVLRFLNELDHHDDWGVISVVRASDALLKLIQAPKWGVRCIGGAVSFSGFGR